MPHFCAVPVPLNISVINASVGLSTSRNTLWVHELVVGSLQDQEWESGLCKVFTSLLTGLQRGLITVYVKWKSKVIVEYVHSRVAHQFWQQFVRGKPRDLLCNP